MASWRATIRFIRRRLSGAYEGSVPYTGYFLPGILVAPPNLMQDVEIDRVA